MATAKGSLTELVLHYRNFSGEHLQELWNQIYKQGIKGEFLRDILMYYFQHKIFPPPPQKFYDTLLLAFVAKGTSKKIKNVIFQVIEEISFSLESSILESVSLSASSNTTVELLNSVLVGGFVPLLERSTIERLFAALANDSLSSEEGGKLLLFLSQVAASYPAIMPNGYKEGLGEMMAGWLCNTRAQPGGGTQFFSRSEKQGGSEVDGAQLTAGDIFTVLTLANNFSKNHLMGIHTFSILRDWLERVEPKMSSGASSDRRPLLEFVREYCSVAVRQSLRTAQTEHDRALQKSVLCEVLCVLGRLVRLDAAQRMQSLLIVKRIQGSVTERFRSDPRDVSILVCVMRFYFSFGDSSDGPEPFHEQFLGDTVQRSYSSGVAAFDIATLLTDERSHLSPALMQRFFPNLLKLVACHPASLLEEFVLLVPLFVGPLTTVEVFHSLVDLPLLSASLCLHQLTALLLQDKHASVSPAWTSLLDSVRTQTFRASYNHVLRRESNPVDLPTRSYVRMFDDVANHPLVVTCAQVVPLLLDAFFGEVEASSDERVNVDLLQAILKKLRLIYNVPGYQASVHKNLTDHIQGILHRSPGLVFAVQPELTEYISALDNSDACPQLYAQLVRAVGSYASTGHGDPSGPQRLLKYYETLECVLYEMLARIASEEKVSLNLLNVTSSTLAKLASRCQDLIPRLLLCFSKVQRQVSTRLQNVSEDDKQVVHDRIEELITFLRNPNIASPSFLSSSHEVDPALSALLQILAQVTDSTEPGSNFTT